VDDDVFARSCLKFSVLPEDCTVLGGNGNAINTRWRLNLDKKECPAPQSQSIHDRLIPLMTPHSSGWTLPLSIKKHEKNENKCTVKKNHNFYFYFYTLRIFY